MDRLCTNVSCSDPNCIGVRDGVPCIGTEYQPKYSHAGYLTPLIQVDKLRETVAKACRVLANYEYDAIAARGVSGLLILPALALAVNKTMIVVRKSKNETSHSFNLVEGDQAARRYIIADDLVDTGATAKAITEAIREWAPQAQCLGVLECYKLKEDGPSTLRLL